MIRPTGIAVVLGGTGGIIALALAAVWLASAYIHNQEAPGSESYLSPGVGVASAVVGLSGAWIARTAPGRGAVLLAVAAAGQLLAGEALPAAVLAGASAAALVAWRGSEPGRGRRESGQLKRAGY